MTQFDPASFLESTTTEASVKRPPLTPGDYTAVTGAVTARQWESQKPDAKVKSGIAFDIEVNVEVPLDVRTTLGLTTDTLKFKDSIMIEMNAQGGIDYSPGKNGSLRRWREATGNNTPGKPFAPSMLSGQVVKVKIGHRSYEGELYDEIQGVTKA